MSHLRKLTQHEGCETVLKYGDQIFTSDFQISDLCSGDPKYIPAQQSFQVRLLAALYRCKYNPSFRPTETLYHLSNDPDDKGKDFMLLKNIRTRLWLKTLLDHNQVPSYDAVCLRSQRFTYVLNFVCNATVLFPYLDPKKYAWFGDPLKPVWDSPEHLQQVKKILDVNLGKCKCKKMKCSTKQCPCRREGDKCSPLCTCYGCLNDGTVR